MLAMSAICVRASQTPGRQHLCSPPRINCFVRLLSQYTPVPAVVHRDPAEEPHDAQSVEPVPHGYDVALRVLLESVASSDAEAALLAVFIDPLMMSEAMTRGSVSKTINRLRPPSSNTAYRYDPGGRTFTASEADRGYFSQFDSLHAEGSADLERAEVSPPARAQPYVLTKGRSQLSISGGGAEPAGLEGNEDGTCQRGPERGPLPESASVPCATRRHHHSRSLLLLAFWFVSRPWEPGAERVFRGLSQCWIGASIVPEV